MRCIGPERDSEGTIQTIAKRAREAMRYRIGVDIGGTFTDFALVNDTTGEIYVHKLLTTSRAPEEGAIRGANDLIRRSRLDASECVVVVHGTTLVINSITERKGSRTALITTRGFRDILEMRTEQRYDPLDLGIRFPDPLVPRKWRFEVDERVLADGTMLRAVSEDELARVLREIRADKIESVAVVFLHAFMNSENEHIAERAVAACMPDVERSVSASVAPVVGEYQRTSTVVANAYVKPLVRRYISELVRGLRDTGIESRIFLMASSGGLMGTESAAALPIRILESGPAAGSVAAGHWAKRNGWAHVVSFDMGGTTAKICLVDGGSPRLAGELEAARMNRYRRGSGLPIRIPTVELLEIGSGGGSIARIDRLGLLKVGPESAGADPGPACYGFGGSIPTATDASVVMGYISPDAFLGGEMKLDMDAAAQAIDHHVAAPLSMSVRGAAAAIHRVINENMATALRIHLAEQGRDPRHYILFAFGGAGPIHATAVARSAGFSRIVIPQWAGVMSSLGLLMARPAFDVARSYVGKLRSIDWRQVWRLYREMEEECLDSLRAFGDDTAKVEIACTADMRYIGQEHLLNIDLPLSIMDEASETTLREIFDRRHEEMYGFVDEKSDVECLVWRLSVIGRRPELSLPVAPSPGGAARKGVRRAYLAPIGREVDVPVWDRYKLGVTERIEGPGIIEERESVIVMLPGDIATVDAEGNVIIEVARNA